MKNLSRAVLKRVISEEMSICSAFGRVSMSSKRRLDAAYKASSNSGDLFLRAESGVRFARARNEAARLCERDVSVASSSRG
jgi:hypothetical protein